MITRHELKYTQLRRLCPCGEMLTESHVTQHSIFAQHLSEMYDFVHIQNLLSDKYEDNERCGINI